MIPIRAALLAKVKALCMAEIKNVTYWRLTIGIIAVTEKINPRSVVKKVDVAIALNLPSGPSFAITERRNTYNFLQWRIIYFYQEIFLKNKNIHN